MSTARTVRVVAALVGVSGGLGVALTGCSRDRPLTDEARRPLTPGATVSPHQANEYELGPAAAEVSFGPRQRPMRGRVRLSHGRLWLDANDLAATRATLTFDLTSFVVDGPRPSDTTPADVRSLTEQSLDWLEIRDPARLAESPERRYARFEVSSFVPMSGVDASGQLPSSPAGAAQRLRGRASGELELHGYRMPYTVTVAVTFSWQDPARFGGPPERVELALAAPASVEPLRHEIVPRNARGEVQWEALAELRKLPANPVQVSGRWVAEWVRSPSYP